MKDKMTLKEIHKRNPVSTRIFNRTKKRIAYDRWKTGQLGKMGAASPVRHIDPLTIDCSKYIGEK